MKLNSGEHKDILESAEAFNTFVQNLIIAIRHQVMIDIPEIVLSQIKSIQEIGKAKEAFWENNSDLRDHLGLLAQTVTSISAQNPAMSREDVYGKASEKVREILKEESKHA